MSKTLDEIKDEVSIDLEKVTYKNLKISDADEIVTAIATRFAAEQNAQMKADIVDARRFMQAYIDICEADKIKHLTGDNVRGVKNFLERTAHYDI